jgi:mRNA-degrading endonuclease RelE of RelBE toxin-antitoxin system
VALILTDRFKRAYQRLPANIQRKVKKALRQMAEDVDYPGLHVHKIQGTDAIYEGQVDHKYHFSFSYSTDDIVLRNVDNHDECLKNP